MRRVLLIVSLIGIAQGSPFREGHDHIHAHVHSHEHSYTHEHVHYDLPAPPPPAPPTGPVPPLCGCYTQCDDKLRSFTDLVIRTRASQLVCGSKTELCCFENDPWPGITDTFAHLAPCVPDNLCKRPYGSSATDVRDFGVIGPCPGGFGVVRCLDGHAPVVPVVPSPPQVVVPETPVHITIPIVETPIVPVAPPAPVPQPPVVYAPPAPVTEPPTTTEVPTTQPPPPPPPVLEVPKPAPPPVSYGPPAPIPEPEVPAIPIPSGGYSLPEPIPEPAVPVVPTPSVGYGPPAPIPDPVPVQHGHVSYGYPSGYFGYPYGGGYGAYGGYGGYGGFGYGLGGLYKGFNFRLRKYKYF